MKALREAVFLTVMLLVSSAAGLVIAEVGMRLFADGERFFPYYPNSVRYNYPSEEITPGVSGPSRFSTNSLGVRGRELQENASLRIITIGGSTTADTVLDDTESWPWVLQEKLSNRLPKEKPAWVINSGIDGRNSDHHLMHVKYFLPQLGKMDYVIIHAGINDLGVWLHNKDFDPNFLNNRDNWNSRIGESFRWSSYTPADAPIYKRLEIWKLLSRLKDIYLTYANSGGDDKHIVQDAQLEWLQKQRRDRASRQAKLLSVGKLSTLPAALQYYEDNLRRIVREVRKQGAQPILMAQVVQSIFKSEKEKSRLWLGAINGGEDYISEGQYPAILDQYNKRMQKVANGDNVHYIDLPNLIARDASLFYDGMHFNEAGARAVASVIVEYLATNGLLAKD